MSFKVCIVENVLKESTALVKYIETNDKIKTVSELEEKLRDVSPQNVNIESVISLSSQESISFKNYLNDDLRKYNIPKGGRKGKLLFTKVMSPGRRTIYVDCQHTNSAVYLGIDYEI